MKIKRWGKKRTIRRSLKMNLTYLTGSRVIDTNDRANLLSRHGGVLVESEQSKMVQGSDGVFED